MWIVCNCCNCAGLGNMLLNLVCFLLLSNSFAVGFQNQGFTYNGFQNGRLSLGGYHIIDSNGILNIYSEAYYLKPFRFKKSQNTSSLSFSTTFVFAMVPWYSVVQPFSFMLSPYSIGGYYTHGGIAVVLGYYTNNICIQDSQPIPDAAASYFVDDSPGDYRNLTLASGKRMQVWIEYDGVAKLLNVTIAPFLLSKPKIPLLSLHRDISPVLLESMYAGFIPTTYFSEDSCYIFGWSFQLNGQARALDLSHLPRLPPKKHSKVFTIELPIILLFLVFIFIFGSIFLIRKKRKLAGEIEDWELGYGGQRFSYQELYMATKGFKESELLGSGGFGRVYRGVLGTPKRGVAVKRISHESRQGIREFIAEIVSLGKIRHRYLVQLLGYCRQEDELFLVYDYMSNGSLDKFLFSPLGSTLSWNQRFRIIKGVASGLFYLHEEWNQVVIHRDIKASNVLIDKDFNGKLGDFGLARLYDHGTNLQATRVAGTRGYMAPEMARTGMATTKTDVFAFGAFLLEVACGRRPIAPRASDENIILVDWVTTCLGDGNIFETTDPNLGNDYVKQEMETVLKLGLLCSHSNAMSRPSMRHVVQILDNYITLPELCSGGLSSESQGKGCDVFAFSGQEESLMLSGR